MYSAAALAALACPVCHQSLGATVTSLYCRAGHRFDLARQGQVNLLGGKGSAFTGDTAEMVADRLAFLCQGHYLPIARTLSQLAQPVSAAGVVCDVGGGPGWYLQQLLRELPGRAGISCDISVYAARRAAKVALSVICDSWQRLPLHDGAVAVLLNVFAPRQPAEFARVLHPAGRMLVVTPQADHLTELVADCALIGIDPAKQDRLDQMMATAFTAVDRQQLRWQMSLSPAAIGHLVGMGPNAFHRTELPALTRPRSVTAAVTVTAYQRR